MTKVITDQERSTTVPLLDLKRQYQAIQAEIQAAVAGVFDRQQFILGPEVKALEEAVAAYTGVSHAIGCASGSDALMLALMALGVGPGDEVIIPTYTFFATAGAVARLGAKPVFVDIRPDDFNLDEARVAERIGPRTKAIMPVHLFGQCADMTTLNEIAAQARVPVIEDGAQAIGATFGSHRAGALGTMGCFSFFPSKNLGGAGDGGMVVTNDDELAAKLGMLRVHGSRVKYHYELLGVNSRLDELQAAVLRVKLKYLDAWSAARAENARRYDDLFAAAQLDDLITLPLKHENRRHIYNQYVIRVPERDALMQWLKERGIGTEIYYPLPLHQQPCFLEFGADRAFPVAEQASRETLALPIYPELTEAQQSAVVEQIAKFYRQ